MLPQSDRADFSPRRRPSTDWKTGNFRQQRSACSVLVDSGHWTRMVAPTPAVFQRLPLQHHCQPVRCARISVHARRGIEPVSDNIQISISIQIPQSHSMCNICGFSKPPSPGHIFKCEVCTIAECSIGGVQEEGNPEAVPWMLSMWVLPPYVAAPPPAHPDPAHHAHDR